MLSLAEVPRTVVAQSLNRDCDQSTSRQDHSTRLACGRLSAQEDHRHEYRDHQIKATIVLLGSRSSLAKRLCAIYLLLQDFLISSIFLTGSWRIFQRHSSPTLHARNAMQVKSNSPAVTISHSQLRPLWSQTWQEHIPHITSSLIQEEAHPLAAEVFRDDVELNAANRQYHPTRKAHAKHTCSR